jgi:hypothetical protein
MSPIRDGTPPKEELKAAPAAFTAPVNGPKFDAALEIDVPS